MGVYTFVPSVKLHKQQSLRAYGRAECACVPSSLEVHWAEWQEVFSYSCRLVPSQRGCLQDEVSLPLRLSRLADGPPWVSSQRQEFSALQAQRNSTSRL